VDIELNLDSTYIPPRKTFPCECT